MLFNEYNEQIKVIVFLFPYEKVDPKSQELGYCIQSLMLPTMTFTYDDIQSLTSLGLIDLILLLSDVNVDIPVASLKCPNKVTPIMSNEIVGVYTEKEIMQRKMQ